MNKIIILNGPNLNLLGEREKSQYGSFTLKDIEKDCKQYAMQNDLDITMFQSNLEGELVEKIQNSRNVMDNPGNCPRKLVGKSNENPAVVWTIREISGKYMEIKEIEENSRKIEATIRLNIRSKRCSIAKQYISTTY